MITWALKIVIFLLILTRCVACEESWPTLDLLARKFHGLPDDCYKIKSAEEIKTQMKRISTADHLVGLKELFILRLLNNWAIQIQNKP